MDILEFYEQEGIGVDKARRMLREIQQTRAAIREMSTIPLESAGIVKSYMIGRQRAQIESYHHYLNDVCGVVTTHSPVVEEPS